MLRTQAAIVCGLILTSCVSPSYEYRRQDLDSRTDGPGTSNIELVQ